MAARDRFTEILRQNAPGGGTGKPNAKAYRVHPPTKRKPAQGKKPARAEEPKGPKEGENVDALEKMISGAAKRNRVDDVIDSTLSRADAEANKPKTGQGSRTPIRREYPAEEIRDLIATPEGLAELRRHIGDDPGNKKQKAIRAALYARNQSWADDFDLALAGESPAPKLDAGFEGVGAGEGAAKEAAEGDGVYISPPDDPKKITAAEKKRGGKKKIDVEGKGGKVKKNTVNVTEVEDVTLVRKRLPESRSHIDRMGKEGGVIKGATDKTLSVNLKNAYAQLKKWYKQLEKDGLTKDADGTVVYPFEEFAKDYSHKVTDTKIVDDTKVRAKPVDGNKEKRRGYLAENEANKSQEARQRSRAVAAAGFDPAAPEGFSPGAAIEDVVPESEFNRLRQRSTQSGFDRQDAARRLMDDNYTRDAAGRSGSDQVLNYLRQADEETALKIAHRAARDAMIDRIPTAERATAVADQDAIHGVVQGLMAAAGREMPAVMPEWYNKVQRDAKRSTDASFQSRGERSAAQPSRVAPASAPSTLPNKRFDPTINARPELDPKPTLPVTQRPQGKVPKNIEEELSAYHAGEITDPDQKAYLEDIIETRRQQGELFRESEKARIDREKAAARAKTRVNRKSQNTVLPESSDVTVAEAPTTPGTPAALNEGTDMASKKSTVVDAIAGKPSGKKAGKAAGADIAPDTAAANLDADSGVRGARSAAGDASSARGQASLVPLTERYAALAEDARNADPSMAGELNERLATLDEEILKLGEKAGTAHFEAAGAAEDAVKRLGAPATKPAAPAPPVVGTKPAAGKGGKKAAAEPVAPAATEVTAAADDSDKQMEQWGNDIFRRMVTEEWEKARKARGGNAVPMPAPPAPKPEPKPKAAPKQETQVGVADDAVGGDGNLDVTAKPKQTRVRSRPQPDTSEMDAARMADEGGMEPVGPNPKRYEREWDDKQSQLEDAAYAADLDRRQRAASDAAAKKVADEQARRAQYSSQWDNAEEAVDEAHSGRVRRGIEARIADEGWSGMRVEAERIARARREADAAVGGWDSMGGEARRLHNDYLTNENGDMLADMARRGSADTLARQNDDMMTAMARRGAADTLTRQNGDFLAAAAARESQRTRDAMLTASNGDALESAALQASGDTTSRMTAEADRIRMQRALIGAAAAAGAGGVYAQTEAERPKAPAPAEPPEQVPDRPTETQVGLPDDGPDLTEDVSIDAPPPPGRRLPPGYRAPQAARYQAPPEEELVLANPNRDGLALPDPNAGRDLFLTDPNAGRVSMGPERATNSDDPRAKLSRLMKALGR
jgi:hypothetical protein